MTFFAQCQALVAEYVALLVPDWKISVELFDGRTKGRLVEGECYPDWQYKGGLLRFHDFDKYPVPNPIDPDLLVAHEVGHCVVAVMCTKADTWERRAEEWIVETYARAMVALKMGLSGAPARLHGAPARLAGLVRYRNTVRRRMASAEGKRRMTISQETAQAALDALQSGDNTAAIEVLKTILAEAMGAAGEEPVVEETLDPEAPVMDVDPSKDPNAPPMAMDPAKDPKAPPQRAAKVSALLAQAESDAKKTAALARQGLRNALITSAPDVFPETLTERRARYSTASPEEIERFIASHREEVAMRKGDGRQRSAPSSAQREPAGSSGPPHAGEKPEVPETNVIPMTRSGMFSQKGQ